MYDLRSVMKWVIGGLLSITAFVAIITILSKLFLVPLAEGEFESSNPLLIIILTSVPVVFLIKMINTYSHWVLRYFSEQKYIVVDGLLPILSNIRSYQQYIDLTKDEYTTENKYGAFTIGVVKLIGVLLVVMPVLLYLAIFGGGVYVYLNYGMFMFTEAHIIWILICVFLYGHCIGVETLSLAYSAYSLNPYILSYNPKGMIVVPYIMPILSIGYLAVIIVNLVTGGSVSVAVLNLIMLIGIPMVNPIVAAINCRKAVNDSKITVDESRRREGAPPITW